MEKSLRQRVIDMEKGDILVVSVSDVCYTTVRSYAYEVGFDYDRNYSVHRDSVNRTYTITRNA